MRSFNHTRSFVVLLLLPLLVSCFLSVGYSQLTDTSIISMSGTDWSLKVDSTLASSIDSRNTPYMVSKSATEKELFLQLNTLEDCKSGVVQFKIDTTGLVMYKQLALTVEEIQQGNFRPQNVINSYACFDSDGKKVLHIYASKVTDIKGVEIWLDQIIENGILTVYLPKAEVLEGLSFPLLLDPTFGYTSVGASTDSWGGGVILGCKFNLTEFATVTNISMYTEAVVGTPTAQLGVYSDNAGSPNALLGYTSDITPTTAAWYSGNCTISLSAGTYWLAVGSSGRLVTYYDTGATDQYAIRWTGSFYPLTDPFGTLDSSAPRDVSIYATYTTEGATPTPTPSPSPSPSPVPSSSPSSMILVLGEADWVLVLEIVMLVACFVSYVWLSKVPFVPLLVGLFAFLVSLYCGLSGLWSGSLVIGFFGSFVAVVGGLTMLLVGLGVRVRR